MSISLSATALKQLLQLKRRGLGHLVRTRTSRTLSLSASRNDWRKDTPTEGLTQVYVYTPDSQTIWPDPILGVFAAGDPRFGFPGNVGSSVDQLLGHEELQITPESNVKVSRMRFLTARGRL